MNKLYNVKYTGNAAANLLSVPLQVHRRATKRFRRIPRAHPVKKILAMKMWGIGNLTILLPILKRIREQYAEADIYFLTLDSNKGLLESSLPGVKILYVKLTTNVFRIAMDFFKYIVIFSRLKLDLLLNFEQCNRLSIIFSYMMGAKRRVGFEIAKCGYNSLYTDTVKNDPGLHVSRNFTRLARRAGIDINGYRYMAPEPEQHSRENAKNILRRFGLEDKTIVALHAGSGENFTGKRWKNSNFACLADGLIERYGVTIVYTGTEKEDELIENTRAKMKYKAHNLCGYFTLQELTVFLQRCHLFISNDTGPLHIAISLGINTVGLYGPMDPGQYGSLNDRSLSFYKPMECSPCLTDLNNKTSLCERSECLDNITYEEVMEKVSDKFFKHEEAAVVSSA
ncbi:MAG: glycosyltransferase family 9 protein [Candidatus Omnitrophica bacterium]|nr:glycosyltransferase family 9 protein [Candidatus Omnitrophota bacterium]